MNKNIFQQLKKIPKFSFLADGESMLPLLHPKDLVNYQRVSYQKLKTNDTILVFKNNVAFTHRIIYKTNKYLVTKGDNNLESDPKISPSQIIGKVVSVKRKNRTIDPEMIYLIQSSLYLKEIIKIVTVLEKNNIEHVFLKGLPVHLYYEKTHPRRIYQDADVLINLKNYKKLKKILNKLGYKKEDHSLSPLQKKFRDKDSEISFYKIINGFPVVFDIHFEIIFLMNQLGSLESLYPQKKIENITNKFLSERIKVDINGTDFYLLSPVNLAIFLAFHLFRHNFTGPYRYELLEKVIKKLNNNPMIINQLIDTVNQYQLLGYIAPVFYLLLKYFKTPDVLLFFHKIKQFNNEAMKQYDQINIFDDQDRLSTGIKRFFLLFKLSPEPIYKKMFIVFTPKVISLVIFTVSLKIKNLLKKSFNITTLNL